MPRITNMQRKALVEALDDEIAAHLKQYAASLKHLNEIAHGDVLYRLFSDWSTSSMVDGLLKDACGKKEQHEERYLRQVTPSREWIQAQLDAEEIEVEYEFTDCMTQPAFKTRLIGWEAELKRAKSKARKVFNRSYQKAIEEAQELRMMVIDIRRLKKQVETEAMLSNELQNVLSDFKSNIKSL